MASETLSISRPQAPRISLDYDALYQAGIKHIEKLSGNLWTNYNGHDPGITALEILCYGITELSYRADFPIRDIIARDPAAPAPVNPFPSLCTATGKTYSGDLRNFFSLSCIAGNAPLTVNDYRKLLIDLPGIRNAWLERVGINEAVDNSISRDTSVYLYDPVTDPHLKAYQTGTGKEVKLRGLYKVYVQFEEDKDFGDLNDNSMATEVILNLVTGLTAFEMEVEFPVWENLDAELDNILPADVVPSEVELVPGSFIEDPDEAYTFDFQLTLRPSGRSVTMALRARVVSGQETVLNKDDFRTNLKAELDGTASSSTPWVIDLIQQFIERRTLIQQLLDDVREALADHRNLCEDFYAIYPISLQEIGLDLELEVEPGRDCELIMARAYRAMELYLSPVIRFYSLREMLEKGYEPEEIFQGPILNNGFIDGEELSFNQRREILYTSDLIKEIMAIEGVKTVRYIALSRYMRGELQIQGATECLRLIQPARFLPRLIYTRSQVRIDDGGGTAKAPDTQRALELLQEFKALDQLKGTAGQTDLPEPAGTYRALDGYHSIQHEFPLNYGIGTEGLASTESDKRKSQAHQFKAYLLFFEQLLANYLSQLANVRRLYSFQEDEDRTYFTQALFQVPQVRDLLADFTDPGNSTTWEDYVALTQPVNANHYQVQLDNIAEDKATFHDRRKRFLDHLIARFNESFTEYAAYVFTRNWDDAQKYSTLIGDQVRFLRKYDEHSYDRGTAFNYQILLDGFQGTDFWNSDRVTGLKKRMVYSLGMPKVEREYISPFNHFEIYQDGSQKYRYRLRQDDDPGSLSIFYGPNSGLDTEEDILDWLEMVIEAAGSASNFVDDNGTLRLRTDAGVLGTVSSAFLTNVADGDTAVATRMIQERIESFLEIENFHLIEHILLRPRDNSGATLEVRLDPDCPELNIKDPYSFRASVVLPVWAKRFKEFDFRRLFKRMIRLEAPAHVLLHFYWVDARQMYYFENCWADWLNGEWIPEDAFLLQETSDYVQQENAYNLRLERQIDQGDDNIAFVHCLDMLKNLRDAYYVMEPSRIVDQYKNCDLIAYPVDPDGQIVRAWMPDESQLPPGTCLNKCNGEIRVFDAEALLDADENYELEIFTTSSAGETTCHAVTINFIANGPAEIETGPVNQHIGKYQDTDEVVTFEDPDGDIIQATLITGVGPQNDALPPGMAMDPLTGTITISDATLLTTGSYDLEVKLMDEEGGVTFLQFTIEVQPDIPAQFQVTAPDTKNEDAFVEGDEIFRIWDSDDGIASAYQPVNSSPTLDDLGLIAEDFTDNNGFTQKRWVIAPGRLSIWRSALMTWFQLNGSHYELPLYVFTDDNCGGTTLSPVPLRIYRDNDPEVIRETARNEDAYQLGDVLATIRDLPDNGLTSATPTEDLSLLGLGLVQFGTTFKVIVTDVATFQTALNSEFATAGRLKNYTFTANTEDNTGGRHLTSVLLQVIADRDPVVTKIVPVKNMDLHFNNDEMAEAEDPDGNGFLTVTQKNTDPYELAQAGLKGIIELDTAGIARFRIIVENENALRGAVSDPSIFIPVVGSAINEVEQTFTFDSIDLSGGRGEFSVRLVIIRDFDGDIQQENNSLRVTVYQDPTRVVIWRITGGEEDVNLDTFSADPELANIPGVAWRTNAQGEIEIYVDDPTEIVAGRWELDVTVSDSSNPGAGADEYSIFIEFLPRLIKTEFEFGGLRVSYPLLFGDDYPDLILISVDQETAPPSSFGLVTGIGLPPDTKWEFVPGSAFSTTTRTEIWQGRGTMTGKEVVDVEICIKRKISTRTFGTDTTTTTRVSSVSDTAPEKSRITVQGLTASDSSQAKSIASESNKVLANITSAQNYTDNPLLQSNPKLVADYASGKKDHYVGNELLRLTESTVQEIERLQAEILSSTGKKRADARADLAVYAEAYRQQVLGAVEYSGQVRNGDLGEQGTVKRLFEAIGEQMKRIK
ncbi:MAG: hypothetical protein AAF998_13120 [Bacteroidota bacterium]